MGSEDGDANPSDSEGPVRLMDVAPFSISAHTVTAGQFATFVEATGYTSDAERFGWSFVFATFLPGPVRAASPRPDGTPWWCAVSGASSAVPGGTR